jgi:hypothetical protein
MNPLAKLSASTFGVTEVEAPDKEMSVASSSLHASISPAKLQTASFDFPGSVETTGRLSYHLVEDLLMLACLIS